MRVPVAAVLLLAAGCVTPDPGLTSASLEESPPPEPPAPTPPPPTPQPVPTPPPSPTPSNRTDARQPAEPEDLPDHHAEQEGWIVVTPPATSMTVRIPVPVQAGARNLTVDVRAFLASPLPAAAPVQPANVSVSLFGADGAELASKSGEATQPRVVLDWADLARPGEYAAVLTLVGASHGDQAGHKYHAVVHVAY